MKENENKWLMFKNYMHNELGITKEDIRQWIQDAVEEQARKLIQNEFNNFDVKNIVNRIIMEDELFGSKRLKNDITRELSNKLMERIKFD